MGLQNFVRSNLEIRQEAESPTTNSCCKKEVRIAISTWSTPIARQAVRLKLDLVRNCHDHKGSCCFLLFQVSIDDCQVSELNLQVVHISAASSHRQLRNCSTGNMDAADWLGPDVIREMTQNYSVAQRRGNVVGQGHFKFRLQNLKQMDFCKNKQSAQDITFLRSSAVWLTPLLPCVYRTPGASWNWVCRMTNRGSMRQIWKSK